LAATRHICSTCGNVLAPAKKSASAATEAESAVVSTESVETKAPRSFWKSLFGVPEETAKEQLGET
jgi:hypothetical protein